MTRSKVAQFGLLAAILTLVVSAQRHQREGKSSSASKVGVIRVNAPSVVVDVIVTDKKGRPVSGLTANDFAVYENNARQKIVTFVPPPLVANQSRQSKTSGEKVAKVSPSAQAVSSASVPTSLEEKREFGLENLRFITLVIDLGDLQPTDRKAACDAAAKYLRRDIAPEDYVSIYAITQNRLDPLLAFSRNPEAAEQAIQALAGRAPSGILTADERREVEGEMAQLRQKESDEADSPAAFGYRLQRLALRSMLWSESAMQARSVFVALRSVAQSLGSLPGRKNVILFSEGFINSRQDAAPMAAVIDAANRANVAFYVIDASGLTLGREIFSAENREASGARLTRGETPGPPVANTLAAEMNEMAQTGPEVNFGTDKLDWAEHLALSDPDADLEQIANATGGLMIRNQNDLLAGLERVDSDLREYYTLVYQPSDAHYDGTFRRIRVELSRRGDELRYRKGYWAIPPGEAMTATPAAAQLVAAAEAGTLQPAFRPPMNTAELVAGNGKWAVPVSVFVRGKDIGFVTQANVYRAGVTMVVTVRDLSGSLLGVYQRFFDLRLGENRYQEFRKTNFDLTAQVEVPQPQPVVAQTILQFSDGRVALATERIGLPAVHTETDIQVTSLVLTNDVKPIPENSADASDTLQVEGFELGLLPEPRFSNRDAFTVYFAILNIPVSPITGEPDLRLAFAIKSGANTVLNPPGVRIETLPHGHDRLEFLKPFDLKGLRPGSYTFEATVEDALHHHSVTRTAPFFVQ